MGGKLWVCPFPAEGRRSQRVAVSSRGREPHPANVVPAWDWFTPPPPGPSFTNRSKIVRAPVARSNSKLST